MKWKTANYLFPFVYFLFDLDSIVCDVKAQGLYKPSGSVFILDQNNFNQNIVRSPSAWIVEFYNSWCGHCIRFAPVWKEFAVELEGWWPVVRVGAVDCANDLNTELCRKFDITGFPAFKMFEPDYPAFETRETFYGHEKNPLEEKVLAFVSNATLFEAPKSWPRLYPIKSMEDIWDETKDEHLHIAFIFEEPESIVGRQVILDTFRYKPLLVRRMLKKSVEKYGIKTFPSAFLINRDGTFTRIAKNNSSREGMVSALKNLLTPAELEAGNQYINQRPRNIVLEVGKDGEPDAGNQGNREAVYMKDLESTLHYSLRQEVAICRDISGEKFRALRLFLNVLAKYFPGREEVTVFLQKVAAWLKDAGTELTGDQWINALDEIQTVEDYLPERVEWVGCAGSEPRFRGYPCGMWTLFHTLTVAAYQTSRANPKDLPLDVLTTIKKYMKYFFGCQTCVDHFLKMADKITPQDKTPNGTVLWLWEAHNMANERLHGDQSEDPKHLKIRFPSKQMCAECYNGEVIDRKKVLDFLISFYGVLGIMPISEDSENGEISRTSAPDEERNLDWWELQQRKKDLEQIRYLRQQKREKQKLKKGNKLSKLELVKKNLDLHFKDSIKKDDGVGLGESSSVIYGWGFTNFDISMCITFYVICTLSIMVLYYHFIVRRKYRPWTVLW